MRNNQHIIRLLFSEQANFFYPQAKVSLDWASRPKPSSQRAALNILVSNDSSLIIDNTPSNSIRFSHNPRRPRLPPQITPSGLVFWQGRVKVQSGLTLPNAPPHLQPFRVGLSKISND